MRFRMIDTRELLLLLVDKYFFSLSLSPRERTHVASARLENVIPPLLLFVYINFTRSIIYRDNSFPYIFVTSKMHSILPYRIVRGENEKRGSVDI